ncbi:MAG: glycosyltransferase [Nocardioidaceae bacterium]
MPYRNPTIVVPVFGQVELARRCLRAIDDLTRVSVPTLIIDDAGTPALTEQVVTGAVRSGRRWRLIRHDHNQGFVATMNEAFDRAAGSDVVIVNSDVTVLPGWLEGLRAAMRAVPGLASASALADNGGILSVPALAGLGSVLPADLRERLAALRNEVAPAALIPVAVGHCTYLARAALGEVGDFDPVFSPGYGEEVDWSLRALRAKYKHAAALHSYVLHDEAASFGRDRSRRWLRRRHEVIIAARYPRHFIGIRRFARDQNSDLCRSIDALGKTFAPPKDQL